MLKVVVTFLCFLGSGACIAGELIRDAVIVEVANTSNGSADFVIRVEGGTGVCAGTTFIVFPESRKASVASFNQAYANALAAFASEAKVRIHNFLDNSCTGASFISISK